MTTEPGVETTAVERLSSSPLVLANAQESSVFATPSPSSASPSSSSSSSSIARFSSSASLCSTASSCSTSFSDCCSAPASTSRQKSGVGLLACEWAKCGARAPTLTHLYDHVVETHISALTPEDRELNRVYSSSSSSGDDDEEDSHHHQSLVCRWAGCGMRLRRGDQRKKWLWLEEHYRTRHAAKALVHRCLIEGCGERFAKTQHLEDHLRTGHGAEEAARRRESAKTFPTSVHHFTPVARFPCRNRIFVDGVTDEALLWRARVTLRALQDGRAVRLERQARVSAAVGSQRRKRRAGYAVHTLLALAETAVEPEEEAIEDQEPMEEGVAVEKVEEATRDDDSPSSLSLPRPPDTPDSLGGCDELSSPPQTQGQQHPYSVSALLTTADK